jgi:hypothetical protein
MMMIIYDEKNTVYEQAMHPNRMRGAGPFGSRETCGTFFKMSRSFFVGKHASAIASI